MPLRYSGARVTTSLVVEAHLIAVYKRAFLHRQLLKKIGLELLLLVLNWLGSAKRNDR